MIKKILYPSICFSMGHLFNKGDLGVLFNNRRFYVRIEVLWNGA